MRLWIMSDLHQEFVRTIYGRFPVTTFDPMALAPEHFDAILIAGDVDVPLTASLRWLHQHFAGCRIIYVAGNHDFYRPQSDDQWTIESLIQQAQDEASKLGIDFLENHAVAFGGVRFIGASLWTDFESVGTRSMFDKTRLALKRMTDYRQIKTQAPLFSGSARRLQPVDTIERHRVSRTFIEAQLAKPFAGKNVVVTHHAPHAMSLDPRFSGELDWCYASDLSALLLSENAPNLWVHGHVHKQNDYWINNCRIVSNPRGYRFVGDAAEGRGFDPSLVIDTDDTVTD